MKPTIQEQKDALVKAAAILYSDEAVKFSQYQFVRLRPELSKDIWRCCEEGLIMLFIKYIPKAKCIVDDLRNPCNLLVLDCIIAVEDPYDSGVIFLPMDSRYLELYKDEDDGRDK